MERTVLQPSSASITPFSTMDHKSSNLPIVVFGSTSAVYFGEDNILLRQEQPGLDGCDFSLVVPRRRIFEHNVSVINILGLQEAELYLDCVGQVTGQLVDTNYIHAFIFVLELSQFTDTDKLGLEWLQRRFGEGVLPYVMILFTYERKRNFDTIIDDLKNNPTVEELLKKCGGRYYTCSKTMNDQSEMRSLLEKIDHLVSENNQRCYAAEMYHTGLKLRDHHERSNMDYVTSNRMTRFPRTKSPEPEQNPNERRIVLLGKTGVGKSVTGNTILGENRFAFDFNFSSVTAESEMHYALVSGRSVSVVDTPGLFDTTISPKELTVEIGKSIYMSSPGPHAFLYILPVNARFTEQEEEVVDILEMIFGEEIRKYMIILFTHGDSLNGRDVNKMIMKNEALSSLVEQCKGYHVFNNEDQSNREQVTGLLEKIDKMVEENGGSCYSNQMFEDAARFKREAEEWRRTDEEERRPKNKHHQIQTEQEKRVGARKIQETHTEQEIRHRYNEQIEPQFDINLLRGGKIGQRWMEMCRQVEEFKRKLFKERKRKEHEEIRAEVQRGKGKMSVEAMFWRKDEVRFTERKKMFVAQSKKNTGTRELDSGLGTFLKAHGNHLTAAGRAGAGYRVIVGTSAGLAVGVGVGAAAGLAAGPVGAGLGAAIGGAIGATCGAFTAIKSSQKSRDSKSKHC